MIHLWMQVCDSIGPYGLVLGWGRVYEIDEHPMDREHACCSVTLVK